VIAKQISFHLTSTVTQVSPYFELVGCSLEGKSENIFWKNRKFYKGVQKIRALYHSLCKREGKQTFFCKQTPPAILKSPVLQLKKIDVLLVCQC